MNTKLSLLAIFSVAAIMSIGAVAPALANIEDEADVAHDKACEALDVAIEKVTKEKTILEDKQSDVEEFSEKILELIALLDDLQDAADDFDCNGT